VRREGIRGPKEWKVERKVGGREIVVVDSGGRGGQPGS